MDDSNTGKNYSKLFFLEKSYWCPQKKSADSDMISESTVRESNNSQNVTRTNNYNMLAQDKIDESLSKSINQAENQGAVTVLQERERIFQAIEQRKENSGLRIIGVSKQYIQTDCCKKNVVDALKPVNELN